MTREILAFDHDLIHAGNKGLGIDHDNVTAQVDALLEQMTPVSYTHLTLPTICSV